MLEEKNRKNKNLSSPFDSPQLRIENGNPTTHLELSEIFTADDAINEGGFGLFQTKLVLLSGFVWMAKGFDEVLMTYVCQLISCSWMLLQWHSALIMTITTIAQIFGCITYGIWSDKYGRRTALSSCLIFIFVFGSVSAGLPSYTWYLIFRTMASFSMGGLPQALTLCAEYIPAKLRGRIIFILSCFWAIGTIILLTMLYLTTGPKIIHFRVFIAVAAIPAGIAMVMMRFFPESLRYLLVSDEYIPANTILQEMAEMNKKEIPQAQHNTPMSRKKRGRLGDLFRAPHLRSTLLFIYMGLATIIAYNSLDAMVPQITRDYPDHMEATNVTNRAFMGDIYSPSYCLRNMTENQFIKVLWTSALDFPGYAVFMLVVDIFDRRKLLCVSALVSALFSFLLYVPVDDVIVLNSFLYSAMTILVGQVHMIYLMTTEEYPTMLRGTAVGMEAAIFIIGEYLSPYIIEPFLELGTMYLIGFTGIIIFLCAISSACLPWKTRSLE